MERRPQRLRIWPVATAFALATLGALLSFRPPFCEAAPAAASAVARAAQPAMGTILEVTVLAGDEAEARRLADESFAIALRWEDVLSTWRSDAELARLNARSGTGLVAISPALGTSLARMLKLHEATGGAFDPAVGATVTTLREHASGRGTETAPRVPLIGALRLERDAAALRAGVALDAGAVGKGMALDAIAGHLAAAGAQAWFLDFGGSSQLAHGRPGPSQRWSLAIASVRPGRIHGLLALERGSVSTSRALAAHDAAGAIIDPRNGTAIPPPRLATVWAPDATTADAWSTALVVLGPSGVERARAAGLEALYEDAAGVVLTSGFALAPEPLRDGAR